MHASGACCTAGCGTKSTPAASCGENVAGSCASERGRFHGGTVGCFVIPRWVSTGIKHYSLGALQFLRLQLDTSVLKVVGVDFWGSKYHLRGQATMVGLCFEPTGFRELSFFQGGLCGGSTYPRHD